MNVSKSLVTWSARQVCSSLVLIVLSAAAAVGQASKSPIKPGLWETQTISANVMSLPPDAEARIAALPPEQQSMVRERMGGKPVTVTSKSCMTTQASLDDFLNQAQQRRGAMQCTFSNRTQTATTASFDTACTMPQGSMKGHSEFHMIDSEHVSATTHMEGEATGRNGGTGAMKINTTMTSKYLGADCGDVKPFAPPAGK